MKPKILFIDRDGTLIKEPPTDFQVDSLEKLELIPGVITWLGKIVRETDYKLVLVSHQDGLGTGSYPENTFWPAQNKMLLTLKNEGIEFEEVLIDKSSPAENSEFRKPRTGLVNKYINEIYDLENSFVIGDRMTDIELAFNMGINAIHLNNGNNEGIAECTNSSSQLKNCIALSTNNWEKIARFIIKGSRCANISRKTKETDIIGSININGNGITNISTGIKFFDHMLEQIPRHAGIDLELICKGDLEVDEHHTIEDTAIVLGNLLDKALGSKKGIERYGFCLPMDDSLATVALDFGGRGWIVWDVKFKRDMLGGMPTEMFEHFFKSFSDSAKCNLNIEVKGKNDHHKAEAIFKALAKAIKMAVRQDGENFSLPSTKGSI